MSRTTMILAALLALAAGQPALAQAPAENMTFFITSTGSGDGANLGGIEGADAHCTQLAEAAGVTGVVWRAYLSAVPSDAGPAVHARERIGPGPWHNYNGEMIAENADHLHTEGANLNKESILTEAGQMVNGRGDSPNMHDIITGSDLDGTLYTTESIDNCSNYTSNGEGSVRLGHHDRQGGGDNPTSWNSAHSSRGCSQDALEGTGGAGLFYYFGTPAMDGEAVTPDPTRTF